MDDHSLIDPQDDLQLLNDPQMNADLSTAPHFVVCHRCDLLPFFERSYDPHWEDDLHLILHLDDDLLTAFGPKDDLLTTFGPRDDLQFVFC